MNQKSISRNHRHPSLIISHSKMIAGGFILIICLILSGYWLLTASQQNQDIRQKAATGETNITVTSSNTNIKPDQTITVQLGLDAGGKQLTAVNAKLLFDPQYLKPISVTRNPAIPLVELKPANVVPAGSITILYGVPATTGIYTANDSIASITFKTLKAGETKISFDDTVTAATELRNTAANVILNYLPLDLTITTDQPTAPPSVDTTPPAPGQLTIESNPSASSPTLIATWTAAEDAVTPNTALLYLLCQKSATTDVDTISECEAAKIQDYTANIMSKTVSGLTANTQYAFNVIVKDAAGNKALYQPKTATTAVEAQQSCKWCGSECRLASSTETNCTDQPVNDKICQAKSGGGCETIDVAVNTNKVTLSFKLQGLDKVDEVVPMEIVTSYLVGGQKKIDEYKVNGRVNADKQVKVANFELTQLPKDYLGTVKVYVKPTVALRKQLGEITIVANNRNYSVISNATVLVGDFLQGKDSSGVDQTNVLEIVDLLTVLDLFVDTSMPTTEATKKYDVNFDGAIDIVDLIIPLENFTDTTIRGDTP